MVLTHVEYMHRKGYLDFKISLLGCLVPGDRNLIFFCFLSLLRNLRRVPAAKPENWLLGGLLFITLTWPA